MGQIQGERVVGGLSCSQVLERLSDYLDGDLAPAERAQVETHLRGCEGCARFDGQFQATVRALRAELTRSPGLPPGLRERLRRAIE